MAKKKSAEEVEYDTLCANVREVMATRQGKDFIWHILAACNLYGDIFQGNSRTFYEEGKRAIGLELLQILEDANPLLYATMLLEKAKQKQNRGINDE